MRRLLLFGLFLIALAAPAQAMAATQVKVMGSQFGDVLFDGKGRAIYLFTKERGSTSRCYGDCAVAWPPVLTRGAPTAGAGVTGSKLGTTKRKGGKRQVTYAGKPLYYYITDRRPGQITCHDVFEFGGTWYVVKPDGSAVR